MGRYTGPRNKIARRFGVNLGLKSNSAKVARRLNQRPGVHGPGSRPKAPSSFGKQLIEKQKAKFMYGIRERQLRRYVDTARSTRGNSGTMLLELLEMRLDNVIYRLGFAATRAQARQMVNHGMFVLNGKKMDIPSHVVKIGDTVTIKPNKAKKKLFEGMDEKLEKQELPSWLTADRATLSGKVVSKPGETDFEKLFDVKFIIEYFSTR
ncbi:MAG: 30S ribosomal protein S4 [Candidatus Magasanikbacteria bacterium GW2011_GWA2_56_11]|uniref:Small ribosomal subunit protein uS4 n=1 Tax=Candidatus Magasanikbacteria bacterium GW2011_GWA2_56_11 TaxID=1619044 RepID=A0A0G1YEJ2_9BACT|nr:MAG: 30S ribosomal protein S4 [Candidatus Magasanikbacteria bacterium GW2011_GWA2_56_11]